MGSLVGPIDAKFSHGRYIGDRATTVAIDGVGAVIRVPSGLLTRALLTKPITPVASYHLIRRSAGGESSEDKGDLDMHPD